MRPYEFLKTSAAGVQATAGASSIATAIPTDSSGAVAKVVAIRVSTASETMYVRPGQATVVATAGTGLPVNKEAPTILDVSGCSHIATIRQTNDVVFNITPVENY